MFNRQSFEDSEGAGGSQNTLLRYSRLKSATVIVATQDDFERYWENSIFGTANRRFQSQRRRTESISMNRFCKIMVLGFGLLAATAFQAFPAESGDGASGAPFAQASEGDPGRSRRDFTAEHPRSLAPYFTRATSEARRPDKDGFLQRWLLLEPISKPNRSNTVFTDSYIRDAFTTEYFPDQFTVVPRHGDMVTVAGEELAWHALDTTNFNVKLFRFADGLTNQTYGVIFWAVTVVNSPREMTDVRLAVGSNSASMWWLNGHEAVILSGDRRMVMDDCVSTRLTLRDGRNVIRGAVINGPGMSDFCVRFIDEKGDPVTDLAINLENSGN